MFNADNFYHLFSRCDGVGDCKDATDETNCDFFNKTRCGQFEYQCSNGQCIHISFACDGQYDCGFGDISDESECLEVIIISNLIFVKYDQ